MDKPVQGAHAYGFNAETTGISVLGTYTDAAPSEAAMTSVARIAAWKLGQYGVNPAGTTTLTAGDAGTNYFRKSWAKGAQLTFPRHPRPPRRLQHPVPRRRVLQPAGHHPDLGGGPPRLRLTVKSVTGAGLSGGTKYYTKSDITVNWSTGTPAALIKQNELLVDGKPIATTAGTATSAKAKLGLGTHTVAVRSTHISGRTTTSAAATVIAEKTPPTFTTKPSLALSTGTVSTTAVPVKLSWKAADSAALREVRLTAPVARTYGPATAGASHTAPLRQGQGMEHDGLRLRGQHRLGIGHRHTGHPPGDRGHQVRHLDDEVLLQLPGRQVVLQRSKKASLTWTFTGRSAAWIVSRASTSGQAYVYVDGTKIATVDLKSSTTKYRQALWTKTWSKSAKHTVKVVVVGTTGRPAITTDGLAYLK